MAEMIVGAVTKLWSGEGGRSLYGAYRSPLLAAGYPPTTVVGTGFSSAGEAQQAVQGAMGATILVWRRVDLAGGVESYQGVADI